MTTAWPVYSAMTPGSIVGECAASESEARAIMNQDTAIYLGATDVPLACRAKVAKLVDVVMCVVRNPADVPFWMRDLIASGAARLEPIVGTPLTRAIVTGWKETVSP